MGVTVRFDYLQGTCFFPSSVELDQFLNQVADFLPLGDSWAFLGYGFHSGETYNNSFKSVRGRFHGGIRPDSSGYKLLLHIPGSYFFQLDPNSFLPLCKFLTSSGFNFTRCDIALDDYSRRVSFDEVRRAGEDGNYKLVDSYKCIESKIVRDSDPVPTCYFGSSDKLLRFYNAELVHGIPADRWELQLRRSHAQSVISDYLEDQHCLGQFVTGAVDFGLVGDYWASFRRFDWWESIHSLVGGSLKATLPDFNPTFYKAEQWLFSQVSPTLAVAYSGYGSDRFSDLIVRLVEDGCKRLKPYHLKWIDELKKEVSV